MRNGIFVKPVLAALLLSGIARAGDPTLAETLFREGKALMDAKKFAEACPKLDESYRQDPATGTLLAYAMCEEENGKLASAWTAFHIVIGRSEREGRSDRAAAARRRAALLESRLSRLTVEVPPEVAALSGLVVTRDGVPLPQAAWGIATPTDAGDHVVEAAADGRAPFRATIAIAKEADRKVVRVPMLESAADSAPAAVPVASPDPMSSPARGPAPAPGSAPRHDESAEGSASSLPLLGLVVGGAGIVALGVGTAFGLRAKSLDEDSRDAGCEPATGYCPSGRALELNEDARDSGNIATVLFVAGGALVAGGVVLYLVGSSDNSSTGLGVSPLIAKDGGGALITIRN